MSVEELSEILVSETTSSSDFTSSTSSIFSLALSFLEASNFSASSSDF